MSSAQKPAINRNLVPAAEWDRAWQPVKSRRYSSLNYFDFRFGREFREITRGSDRVLEVGCGGSHWLGFFERELKAEVWGIDFSPAGLELACRDLSPGAQDRLVLGDVFDPGLLPPANFDVIYSMGFLEHFTDATMVTRRIFDLLKPGGRVFTSIPNFVGLQGYLQKTFGREIYEGHVVLDCDDLDRAHLAASFVPLKSAQYFGCWAPLTVRYTTLKRRFKLLDRPATTAMKVAQQALAWPLWITHLRPEWKHTSPFLMCIYQKPLGTAEKPR